MRRWDEASVPDVDIDALRAVLQDAPLTVGVLYGSLARGDQHHGSDVDLAVGFEESLSSSERTTARLAVIEEVSAELGTDDVDVTPLSRAPPELVGEIGRDGILLVGAADVFETYVSETPVDDEREEPFAALDELVSDLKRVV